MGNKPQTVVSLCDERNASLIPRRAATFEDACDRIVSECKDAIAQGECLLPHKELLAILNGDAQTASRMRDLEDRCQRLELQQISGAD